MKVKMKQKKKMRMKIITHKKNILSLLLWLIAITIVSASCSNFHTNSDPNSTKASQISSEIPISLNPSNDNNTTDSEGIKQQTTEKIISDPLSALDGPVDTAFYQSVSPESQGMSSDILYDMYQEITKRDLNFHHILILRNGKIVSEAHYYPYGADDLHIVNSITKDFTSALIGIATDEGLIGSVEDTVVDYFKEWKIANLSDNKSKLTVENLLTMTAGMNWIEAGNYGDNSDTYTQMWQSDSQIQFVLDREIKEIPGSKFYYNTGASHLLSGILTQVTGKSAFEYAKEKLLNPLGIQKLFWSADNQGVSSGGSRLFIAPIDLAKFGMLYLNKGTFQSKQIISEKWIKSSTSKHIDTPHGLAGQSGYGYQWWMNPFGGYSGRGYAGQYLFILPEQNIVAVFMGSMGDDFYAPEQLMRNYVLKAVLSDNVISENNLSDNKLKTLEMQLSNKPTVLKVPKLPTIVNRIDGKTFTLENDETFMLDFDLDASNPQVSNTAEAVLTWHVEDSNYVVKVGLDGVYRFTDCLNFYANGKVSEVGFMGYWLDESTFKIKICPTDADSTYTLTLLYEDNQLKKSLITDMLGY